MPTPGKSAGKPQRREPTRVKNTKALQDMDVDADDDESGSGSDCTETGDEEDEAPVKNPSTNICSDLQKALGGDLAKSFKGSFSFCRTYPDAPNPGLNLQPKGIGRVGLPLTEREARTIKSGSQQVTFGKGERTIINKSIGDTWAMDASQVTFDNPAWNAYIQGVMQDVCKALGVNVTASQPRCELHKLLLYETGSHFLPHVDTEKVNTMFATILFVLPSTFTGGAAHLSHGSLKMSYDCAPQSSAFQTTALAWFAGVTHEIKPITSGFRLALSYNLLHTTTTPRPSLGATDAAVAPLRHVLLSWKQRVAADTPRKIIYLLDSKYPQENLRRSVLKGADAHKIAALEMLAPQHGFQLGLTNLETHLRGSAQTVGCDYARRKSRYGGFGCYYDEFDDEEDDEEVEFDKVAERETTITDIVDLEGKLLHKYFDFDPKTSDTIPSSLQNAVESRMHDDQEYEGYAGELERWYRRTVLVIWPKRLDLSTTLEDDLSDALGQLANAKARRPHKRHHKLVDFLLSAAAVSPGRQTEIGRTVCEAACFWRDFALWTRAVEACNVGSGVQSLGKSEIVKAVEAFSFGVTKTALEKMLQDEASNAQCFQFLEALEAWVNADKPKYKKQVLVWVTAQRNILIGHFKKPVKEDAVVLIEMALKYGGMPMLRDTFIPQIKDISSPDFLLSFALCLHGHSNQPEVSEADQNGMRIIVTDLLSTAISKADFYEVVKTIPSAGYGRPQEVSSPDLALSYLAACLDAGNEALVNTIVARVTDMSTVTPAVAQARAKVVLLPLLPALGKIINARPTGSPPVLGVEQLYTSAIQLYLGALSPGAGTAPTGTMGAAATSTYPTKGDLKLLVQACTVYGGVDLLTKTIWPALKALPYKETMVLEFLQEVNAHKGQLTASGGRSAILFMAEILQLVIQNAVFSDSGNLYYSYSYGNINRTKTLELLRLCVETDNTKLSRLVFARLLDKTFLKADYVEKILVPFIPELRAFLQKHKLEPHTDPFGSAFTTIVSLWAKLVLGPKPDDTAAQARLSTLNRATCKCAHCVEVFDFLKAGADTIKSLHRIGAPKRRHVEQELALYASRACTWQTITGSPQGLMVSKDKEIVAPARWRAAHNQGAAILNSVSEDDGELRRIFGKNYQLVMDMVAGKAAAAPRPSQPGRQAPPQAVVAQPASVPLKRKATS